MLSDEEKKAVDELKKEINNPVEVPTDKFNTFILYNIESARTILNLIKKQQKEIEELKANKGYHLGFIDGGIAKRYEYEDKIKAKIEEVEQWELYNMKIPRLSTLDERLGAKIGIKYVLQSLLEKE